MSSETNDGFNLIETDAEKVYELVLSMLEQSCEEPLYPGDERRIFGEALVMVVVAVFNKVNDAARQTMLRYARGVVLDAIGERFQASRLEGRPATCTIRLSLSAARPVNVIIPAGTRATADGELYFSTSSLAIIPAGELFVELEAKGTESGTNYNGFPADSLTTLVDKVPYVSGVTNTTATKGGDNGEPYNEDGDGRYRERIRLASGAFSTAGPESAYRYWAMTADADICDVRCYVPSAGVVVVYPLLYGGKLPDADTLAAVAAIVSADDIAPMTDMVQVQAPEPVPYDIELVYYTSKLNEADVVANVEGTGGAIDRYNEWQTKALGREINPDQLRRLILAPEWAKVPTGAERVDIVKPIFTDVDKYQVAQWSTNLTVRHVTR